MSDRDVEAGQRDQHTDAVVDASRCSPPVCQLEAGQSVHTLSGVRPEKVLPARVFDSQAGDGRLIAFSKTVDFRILNAFPAGVVVITYSIPLTFKV